MLNEFTLYLGLVFRFLAIVAFTSYILPKQWAEARIRDGLSFSRWAIFWGLIACFIIMGITLFYNFYRQFTTRFYFEEIMNFVAITASLKDFLIAGILVLLYRKRYLE